MKIRQTKDPSGGTRYLLDLGKIAGRRKVKTFRTKQEALNAQDKAK